MICMPADYVADRDGGMMFHSNVKLSRRIEQVQSRKFMKFKECCKNLALDLDLICHDIYSAQRRAALLGNVSSVIAPRRLN